MSSPRTVNMLGKFRVPVGSLVVDAALVIALIFNSGRITERMETFNSRIGSLETRALSPETARRLSVLEFQAAECVRDQTDLKTDIISRLDRIERNFDSHMQNGQHKK